MSGKEIAEVLGGRKVFGKVPAGSSLVIADMIAKGLPQASLERLKEVLQLTDREVSSVLDVSEKTISRSRQEPHSRLSISVSDRLYRVARLYALAEEVLEDKDQAREWLRSPQVGLGGRLPIDLMKTEAGAREVESLLTRIEHGVLS